MGVTCPVAAAQNTMGAMTASTRTVPAAPRQDRRLAPVQAFAVDGKTSHCVSGKDPPREPGGPLGIFHDGTVIEYVMEEGKTWGWLSISKPPQQIRQRHHAQQQHRAGGDLSGRHTKCQPSFASQPPEVHGIFDERRNQEHDGQADQQGTHGKRSRVVEHVLDGFLQASLSVSNSLPMEKPKLIIDVDVRIQAIKVRSAAFRVRWKASSEVMSTGFG